MKKSIEGIYQYNNDNTELKYSFSKLQFDVQTKHKVIPRLLIKEQQFVLKHLRSIELIGSSNCIMTQQKGKEDIAKYNSINNKQRIKEGYHLKSRQCESEISNQLVTQMNQVKPKLIGHDILKLNLNQIYLNQTNKGIKAITTKTTRKKTNCSKNIFLTLLNVNNDNDYRTEHRNHLRYLSDLSTKQMLKTTNCLDRKSYKNNLSHRKLRFPIERYKEVCNEFSMNEIPTYSLTKRLLKDNTSGDIENQSEINKEKKKLNHLMKDSNYLSKSRNIGSVHLRSNGMSSMVTKSNADLMNFGDNYLKINDTEFYHRSKEILNEYQYVRKKADIESDIQGEKKNRLKNVQRNQLIIIKAFHLMRNEHAKYLKIFSKCTKNE